MSTPRVSVSVALLKRRRSLRQFQLGLECLEERTLLNAAFDLIGLTAMRQDPAFAGIDGRGVSVAVIDTGLDSTHPLLAPNYKGGADLVYGGNVPTPTNEHGTHVAGIIGAADPEIGVATGVGLYGLQVFQQPTDGQEGRATGTAIQSALNWVIQNYQQDHIVAVNMSLGSGAFTNANDPNVTSEIYYPEILALEQDGVAIVSAAGNSYIANGAVENSGSPGIVSTFDVGAVWKDDVIPDNYAVPLAWASGDEDYVAGPAGRVVSFSQRPNTSNAIFAPGAVITSTVPGGGLAPLQGTSQASPMVAGCVALLQDAALKFGGRLLTLPELQNIVETTARSIVDNAGQDQNSATTGATFPLINIDAAMKGVQAMFAGIGAPQPGGGAGDPNATLAGAIVVPPLNGSVSYSVAGSIGTDNAGQTNVGPLDVDMYKIQVLTPGPFSVDLTSDPNNPQDFTSYLRLFDASGNQLDSNAEKAVGNTFSRISGTINTPGTFYIGVSGDPNRSYDPQHELSGASGATGNYVMTINVNNTDPNGVLTAAVPIDIGSARHSTTVENGLIGYDRGIPVGPQDVDLFKVVAPDDGTFFFEANTPFASGYVHPALTVFDSGGHYLGSTANDPAADDTGGHPTDASIAGPAVKGETYYVGVSDVANQGYDPSTTQGRNASGTGGLYNLSVTFKNHDINGSIPQAVADQALPISQRQGIIGADTDPNTGQLVQVGNRDVDFVKLSPAGAGILQVSVDSLKVPGLASPVQSVLTLFDANGNVLAQDNGAGGAHDPILQYTTTPGTTYYVSISGLGNDDFDPFELGSGSPGGTGNYRFNAKLLPATQNSILSNDLVGQGAVQTIAVGQQVAGSIGRDGSFAKGASDVDIFKFLATTTQTISISTRTPGDTGADTFLRLFDAVGNEIAYNDNAGARTTDSTIVAQVTAGQTYYIGVNSAGPNARAYNPLTGAGAAPGKSQGDYLLSVTPGAVRRHTPPSDFNGDGIADVGIYQPNNDHFYLNYLNAQAQSVGQVDTAYGFHTPGTPAVPINGDFNGDGIADIGVYLPDQDLFALDYLNARGQSIGQNVFHYGFHTPGVFAVPITGDFNGDGITDVGIYQPDNDHFYLDYLNAQAQSVGQVDTAYGFHTGGVFAVPITGDFNGDGITDVGIYQPNNDHFYLDYLNAQAHSIGQVNTTYGFHNGGVFAVPLTGDFNGDGITDVGIYQPDNDHFYLDYLNAQAQSVGQVDTAYGFHTGGVFAVPITGDFNGDGITDVGIYQPNNDHFYLDYLNAQAHSIGQVNTTYGFHNGGVFAVPLPTPSQPSSGIPVQPNPGAGVASAKTSSMMVGPSASVAASTLVGLVTSTAPAGDSNGSAMIGTRRHRRRPAVARPIPVGSSTARVRQVRKDVHDQALADLIADRRHPGTTTDRS